MTYRKSVVMWLLFLTAFIYNILDFWHTKLLLSLGGQEVNPIMAYIIDTTGTVYSVLVVKVIIFTVLGIMIFMAEGR